ncbi:MAG TPA: ATP-binding cassette domain-containing protein [Candidatus Krumholzibacteria bacterium]
MIQVRDVSKTFKLSRQQKREMGSHFRGETVEAVAGVSFDCQPGRVFGLLGPNGAGKTTTLRMIATTLRPTSGAISVAGHDVTREPEAVRATLGFLTGSTQLYDRLSVNELVRYYADLHGVPSGLYRQRREQIFAALEMESYADRRIAKLSTGMRQKVSIARTMIHDPDVLVLDEATAGLDVIASRTIIQLIRQARDRGKTVLFSTHRMGEVELLCDDLALMHQGRLLFNGTYAEFSASMQSPTLEDEFIRRIEAVGA